MKNKKIIFPAILISIFFTGCAGLPGIGGTSKTPESNALTPEQQGQVAEKDRCALDKDCEGGKVCDLAKAVATVCQEVENQGVGSGHRISYDCKNTVKPGVCVAQGQQTPTEQNVTYEISPKGRIIENDHTALPATPILTPVLEPTTPQTKPVVTPTKTIEKLPSKK